VEDRENADDDERQSDSQPDPGALGDLDADHEHPTCTEQQHGDGVGAGTDEPGQGKGHTGSDRAADTEPQGCSENHRQGQADEGGAVVVPADQDLVGSVAVHTVNAVTAVHTGSIRRPVLTTRCGAVHHRGRNGVLRLVVALVGRTTSRGGLPTGRAGVLSIAGITRRPVPRTGGPRGAT